MFFYRSHLILCRHADIQEIITGVKTTFSNVLMLIKVVLHVVIALCMFTIMQEIFMDFVAILSMTF